MSFPDSRRLSPLDELCAGADQLLRTLFATPTAQRPNPAGTLPDTPLDASARQHAAGLMRVNHVGEVCAQALYLGQALTAREPALRQHLLASAQDEADHLVWCAERLQELDSRVSLLNPLWFGGAFVFGAAAGLAGDGWNLGFVVETERQVEAHLDSHLHEPGKALPEADQRSRAIVAQMKADEVAHAEAALARGGRALPQAIRTAMRTTARVMTATAYRI